MEELFGLSMTTLMYVLVGVVLTCMAVLGVLAARNRIMLKMGLRPIPRRPGQTALIIMGVMPPLTATSPRSMSVAPCRMNCCIPYRPAGAYSVARMGMSSLLRSLT